MGVIKTLALKLVLANLPTVRTYAAALLPELLDAARTRMQAALAMLEAKGAAMTTGDRWRGIGLVLGSTILASVEVRDTLTTVIVGAIRMAEEAAAKKA